MTLQAYLRVIRERWRLVVFVVLISLALAIGITALTPKVYEADVQVFVSANTVDSNVAGSQYDQQAAVQAQVSTFAQLIDTPQVLDAVESAVNLGFTRAQIKDKLSATAPTGQTLVIIHATDGTPKVAAAIANDAADAFITVIEDYKRPTDSKRSAVRLFVTQQADTPTSPISPNPPVNLLLGLFLGLLLGTGLAVARDVLDTRIKDAETLAKIAGRPAMGVVIEDATVAKQPVAARAGSHNMRAENFRQLRANLQFANVDEHPRIIAITSSIPAEGKTMVAVNLASTLAEAGFSVCLVDADLRRPTVARVLGLAGEVGLTSVLINQISLQEALQSIGPNLSVLASGPTPPNPSEILASSYVRTLIRSLLDRVDYVVVDTAPLLPVADGSEVAALADGTLLVARHKLTTESEVHRARTMLSSVDAKLIGVILNRMPNKRVGGYGYTYYRSERYGGTDSSARRKAVQGEPASAGRSSIDAGRD